MPYSLAVETRKRLLSTEMRAENTIDENIPKTEQEDTL